MTKVQAELKREVLQQWEVLGGARIDSVVCRGNGTVEFRRSYFYHGGLTAKRWADLVQKALPAGWEVCAALDEYRSWPTQSYLAAVVQPKA